MVLLTDYSIGWDESLCVIPPTTGFLLLKFINARSSLGWFVSNENISLLPSIIVSGSFLTAAMDETCTAEQLNCAACECIVISHIQVGFPPHFNSFILHLSRHEVEVSP